MVYRFTLAAALAVLALDSANAQDDSRNVAPRGIEQYFVRPQQQPQQPQQFINQNYAPTQQFAQPRQFDPAMQPRQMQPRQMMPRQMMPRQMQTRQGIAGQGMLTSQAQYQNYQPVIGSGLPGAQKDGCNCFQMPEIDNTPAYDPYASKNYWTDICPNGGCGGGCPSGGCSQPKIDFNRFIPRPTQPLFRR